MYAIRCSILFCKRNRRNTRLVSKLTNWESLGYLQWHWWIKAVQRVSCSRVFVNVFGLHLEQLKLWSILALHRARTTDEKSVVVRAPLDSTATVQGKISSFPFFNFHFNFFSLSVSLTLIVISSFVSICSRRHLQVSRIKNQPFFSVCFCNYTPTKALYSLATSFLLPIPLLFF